VVASQDHELIRETIERYFTGHHTGDSRYMRETFLPTAHVEGLRGGQFVSWSLDEYCALFDGCPAENEERCERTLDLIDLSGTAAMVKATLRHGERIFTDYFVLLKVDGFWKIANKVYAVSSG
jgi:Putative lumazine-binding